MFMRAWRTRGAVLVAALAAAAVPVANFDPAWADTDPDPVRLFASPSVADGAGDCSAASPCSLSDAVTAERAARAAMGASMTSAIVVYLHGGTYRVDEPIELGAADSGDGTFRVIYRNYPNESPVLSGGVPVTGWTQVPGEPGVWTADQPAGAPDFLQLHARGHDLSRAHTEPVEGERWTVPGTRERQIKVPADAVPDVADLSGVQVRIMHTWRALRYPIASIGAPVTEQDENGDDVDYRYIRLAGDIATWSDEPRANRGPNDFVPSSETATVDHVSGETVFSGAREFMDTDGEWYLDPTNDQVYLKSNFDPNTVEITAPVHERLLSVDGAEHLTIYGLQFAHSAWNAPLTYGNFGRQGGVRMWDPSIDMENGPYDNGTIEHDGKSNALWWVNPAAVTVANATDVKFLRNGFRDTGANAVNLDKGTRSILVKANIFTDIADTGLFVGTHQQPWLPESEQNIDTDVIDNVFRGMGATYATDSAITMTYPNGAEIRHNLIEEVHNIAINIGYIQGFGTDVRTDLADVQITENRIDGACLTARDCGAWHAVGLAYFDDGVPRSRVVRNWISNVRDNPYSNATGSLTRALYSDGASAGWRLTWNEWDLTGQMGLICPPEDQAVEGDVDRAIKVNPQSVGHVITNPLRAVDGCAVRDNAGLATGYGFLPGLDLATDSVGGVRGPYPEVS